MQNKNNQDFLKDENLKNELFENMDEKTKKNNLFRFNPIFPYCSGESHININVDYGNKKK